MFCFLLLEIKMPKRNFTIFSGQAEAAPLPAAPLPAAPLPAAAAQEARETTPERTIEGEIRHHVYRFFIQSFGVNSYEMNPHSHRIETCIACCHVQAAVRHYQSTPTLAAEAAISMAIGRTNLEINQPDDTPDQSVPMHRC
jgi:hypothetical protein